jgi:hypothetical protein
MPNKKIKLILFLSLLLFSSLVLSPLPGRCAEEKNGLYIEPKQIEIEGSPGQKFKGYFTLYNNSQVKVGMKLAIKGFKVTNENDNSKIIFDENENMSGWIIPEFLEIFPAPGQKKDISFIAQIPDNATSGGHYGAIMFERIDNEPGPANDFGYLILFTVKGQTGAADPNGEITELSLNHFYAKTPIEFGLGIKNSGNTHLSANGKLQIDNLLGQPVANLDLSEKIIYPGVSQTYKWQWEKNLPVGLYKLKVILSDMKGGGNVLSRQSWFIFIPQIFFYYWLIVFLGLVSLYYLWTRKKLLWRVGMKIKNYLI